MLFTILRHVLALYFLGLSALFVYASLAASNIVEVPGVPINPMPLNLALFVLGAVFGGASVIAAIAGRGKGVPWHWQWAMLASLLAVLVFLGSPFLYLQKGMSVVWELELLFAFPGAIGVLGVFIFWPRSSQITQSPND